MVAQTPHTTNRAVRFRDGTQLIEDEVSVLESVISSKDRAWLAQARRLIAAGRKSVAAPANVP